MIFLKDPTEVLQMNAISGLVAPSRKGYVHAVGGSLLITLTPDGTITNGDWMIIVVATYDVVVPTAPSGWTVLQATAVNGTLSTTIYGKIRVAGDSSYAVTLSTGGSSSDGTLFWGSGSDSVNKWVVGAIKSRASIIPSTSLDTIAPSLTTTVDHALVLSFSTERTIEDESDIVSITGAQKWAFFAQNGATALQTTVVGVVRDLSPAGATSDVQFTYVNGQASNGQGIQIAIPPASTVAIDSSVTFIDTNVSGTNIISSFEDKTQTGSGSTLFGNEVPTSQNEPTDTAGVELGVSFTAFVSGAVTAIRYYKGVGASAAIKDGHLWSDAGVLLASVTFVNETASGWQTQYLSTPVALTGGLNYTVSYYTPNGNYPSTSGYFGSTNKYSGPLAVDFIAGAGRSGNGIFTYSATSGAFPTRTFNQTNYFADVVFVSTQQTVITTVVPQPVVTNQRALKQASFVNVGTVMARVSLVKWIAGLSYGVSPSVLLSSGEMLRFDDQSGWSVLAADGSQKANFALDDKTKRKVALNDNGPVGGSSDFVWADDQDTLALNGASNPRLQLSAVVSTPSAPPSGFIEIFNQRIAGKMQLMKQGPSADVEAVQASIWQNNIVIWAPSTNVGSWISATGSSVGSAAVAALASTNVYTQMRRCTFATIAGANTQAGLRSEAMFVVSMDPGIGGFFFSCRFGFDTIVSGGRGFVGMTPTTVITTNEPSSMVNICGFGFDSTDSAWTFMHNSGTGVATKEVISGQGVLTTNNTGYDAIIWNPPGTNKIYYRLVRSDTGATLVEDSVSSNVPTSNVFLQAVAHCGNGTNTLAGDVTMGINRIYVESNR